MSQQFIEEMAEKLESETTPYKWEGAVDSTSGMITFRRHTYSHLKPSEIDELIAGPLGQQFSALGLTYHFEHGPDPQNNLDRFTVVVTGRA